MNLKSVSKFKITKLSLCVYLTFLHCLLLCGCALSPGARLVPKGTFEIGGQATLALGNFNCPPGFPVVPNIGLNTRYGITDRINTGASLYPLYLIANTTLGIEPFVSFCLVRQKDKFPAVISYLELPVFVNFNQLDAFAFPLLGFTLNYEFKKLVPYASYEIALDPDSEGKYRDAHNNVRIGMSHLTSRKHWVSLEVSLNNIGEPSYITNHSVGYPCIQFGISFPVRRKHD